MPALQDDFRENKDRFPVPEKMVAFSVRAYYNKYRYWERAD
jgi:hypothetical protein